MINLSSIVNDIIEGEIPLADFVRTNRGDYVLFQFMSQLYSCSHTPLRIQLDDNRKI